MADLQTEAIGFTWFHVLTPIEKDVVVTDNEFSASRLLLARRIGLYVALDRTLERILPCFNTRIAGHM